MASIDGRGGEFRRIRGSGGDGGVEALRLLRTGKKIGYQAKFFPSKIDWNQVDDAVTTALKQHPELERYVIAIPRDLTGRRAARGGSTEGEWGKWDERKRIWENYAAARGMRVEFEPWTAFELEDALQKPKAAHLIPFFFTRQPVFTREWLAKQLRRTVADLQSRYSPEDHIDTNCLHAFDVIYRHESVRQDLHSVFDRALAVNLRAAAALVASASVTEAALADVETPLGEFLSLRCFVDEPLPQPWPICRWLAAWNGATRPLIALMSQIHMGVPSEDDALRDRVVEVSKVYPLIGAEVFGGRWMQLLPIDGARAVLFTGRAGAGKSHVLARGAETAAHAGAIVVHLLGQHILDNDPRASILKHLELSSWSFSDMLASLDLASEIAGTRAMLVIDALNEGRGLDVWRSHLPAFVRDVNEYERLVLVLSCREEYVPYIVPSELIAQPHPYGNADGRGPRDCEPLGKLVEVPVQGFRWAEEREAAMRRFMDAKGIARPTAPILDDEFFNPLFLSSVCRSMEKAGIKVFPRGLHATSELFEFVLNTKTKALGTPHDGTPAVYNAMLRALDSLASAMVERRDDNVPLSEANAVVSAAFENLPVSGHSWLTILEGSDVLRRDVEEPAGPVTPLARLNEVIRFSFQRLQDHFLGHRLVNKCQDIDSAFEHGEPLAFLIRRLIHKGNVPVLRPAQRWMGVLGAAWTAVAETHGKELYFLPSFFQDPNEEYFLDEWRSVFRVSIRERKGNAFTTETRELLRILWEEDHEGQLEILLSSCCVPGHAWNALYLSKRLRSLSSADRVRAWSSHF